MPIASDIDVNILFIASIFVSAASLSVRQIPERGIRCPKVLAHEAAPAEPTNQQRDRRLSTFQRFDHLPARCEIRFDCLLQNFSRHPVIWINEGH